MRGDMPPELRTARLVLRPLTAADVEDLHALWTAPGVRRYLWDDAVIPREQTAAVVTESEHLFADAGYGLFGARRPSPNELIGFGGYWHFRGAPDPELLYGVAEAEWGRGFATEIAGAVLAHGVERLGFREVRASTDAPNAESARVLEKLGFRLERWAVVGGLDTLFLRYAADVPRSA